MGYAVQTLSFVVLYLFVAIWGFRGDPLLVAGGVSNWVSVADELEYMTTDRPQVIASSVILVCGPQHFGGTLQHRPYRTSPLWHICSAA